MFPEEMMSDGPEGLDPLAGKGPLERSGNGPFPAATPPGGPGEEGVAPSEETAWQGFGEPEEGDPWEFAEPEDGADEATSVPPDWEEEVRPPVPKVRRRGTLSPAIERPQMPLTPQQKLLLLDTWQRSGLPARDFGALVNVSRQTLYAWKRRFEELGPGGCPPPAGRSQTRSSVRPISRKQISLGYCDAWATASAKQRLRSPVLRSCL